MTLVAEKDERMKAGKKQVVFVFAIIILLICSVGSSTFGEIIDRVVAIVNEQVITQSELEREVRARTAQAQVMPTPDIYREVLSGIIEQKLILEESKELEIVVTDREVDRSIDRIAQQNNVSVEEIKLAISEQGLTWQEFRQQVMEDMVRNQVVGIKVRSQVSVTDMDLQEYYEEHRDEYEQPPRVRIEQLFFPVPAEATVEQRDAVAGKAKEVLGRVNKGEDFHGVAVDVGIIEENDSLDLGYFNKGELMDALDREAFIIPVGSVSDIIKTPRGYAIIRVLDRQEEASVSLDVLEEDVSEEIYQEKMRKRYEEWLKELYQEAYIEVKM